MVDADDVSVLVSRDGGTAQALATSWSDSSVDTHVGTFTLTDDADYIVTINYRDKSGNAMTEYRSNQLTIDTKIEEPTYTINGVAKSGDNGGASMRQDCKHSSAGWRTRRLLQRMMCMPSLVVLMKPYTMRLNTLCGTKISSTCRHLRQQ